jgi:hypothetical protein
LEFINLEKLKTDQENGPSRQILVRSNAKPFLSHSEGLRFRARQHVSGSFPLMGGQDEPHHLTKNGGESAQTCTAFQGYHCWWENLPTELLLGEQVSQKRINQLASQTGTLKQIGPVNPGRFTLSFGERQKVIG